MALPIILEGNNCAIKAETGSGKTLSYMVKSFYALDALINAFPKIPLMQQLSTMSP